MCTCDVVSFVYLCSCQSCFFVFFFFALHGDGSNEGMFLLLNNVLCIIGPCVGVRLNIKRRYIKCDGTANKPAFNNNKVNWSRSINNT